MALTRDVPFLLTVCMVGGQTELLVGDGALRLRPVGALDGTFKVPDYQRGYRWTSMEVEALLEDLYKSVGQRYCLQPVVVRRDNDGRWEVIDGQQRLTTLYLLFRFLQRSQLKNVPPPYRIQYVTRERSEAYLEHPTAELSESNIDFFHIHSAARVIETWFSRFSTPTLRQFAADKLYMHLCETAQVIWYEAPADAEASVVFRRLNVGRIPLTDAELLKAALLARRETRRLQRPEEVAAQWDSIERDLRGPDRWAFLTSDRAPDRASRIELLFELIAPPRPRGDTASHWTFRELHERIDADPQAFWDEVLLVHATLMEWFEDRDAYHRVGFLVAEGVPLRALLTDAKKFTRGAFRESLERRTGEHLGLSASRIEALTYDRDGDKCRQVLRLMNVEAFRRLEHGQRYPFRLDKAQRWSLEHIHAQSADELRSEEQWRAWLEEHRAALSVIGDVKERARLDAAIAAALSLEEGRLGRVLFGKLALDVTRALTPPDSQGPQSIHSIFNLALLSSETNSAIGSSVFEVKRRRVLEREKDGDYLPPCTRRVFLKYFTAADAQQVHFWSLADRVAYRNAMLGKGGLLTPYLSPEESA